MGLQQRPLPQRCQHPHTTTASSLQQRVQTLKGSMNLFTLSNLDRQLQNLQSGSNNDNRNSINTTKNPTGHQRLEYTENCANLKDIEYLQNQLLLLLMQQEQEQEQQHPTRYRKRQWNGKQQSIVQSKRINEIRKFKIDTAIPQSSGCVEAFAELISQTMPRLETLTLWEQPKESTWVPQDLSVVVRAAMSSPHCTHLDLMQTPWLAISSLQQQFSSSAITSITAQQSATTTSLKSLKLAYITGAVGTGPKESMGNLCTCDGGV